MPVLEFLTVKPCGPRCRACEQAEDLVAQAMDEIAERVDDMDAWTSRGGKDAVVIRHVDLRKRHLAPELAPYVMLDGTILLDGTDAQGPEAALAIARVLYPDGWLGSTRPMRT